MRLKALCLMMAGLSLCLCNKNPTNAPALPTVAFSSVKQTIAENSDTVTVAVTLSAPSKSNVTVPVIVSDNSGVKTPQIFTMDSTAIVIPAGSLTGSIRLSLIDSVINQNSETAYIRLGAPMNAGLGAGFVDTMVIVNDIGFGQHFKFADNELPGWIQSTDTTSAQFTVWKGDSLVGFNDGGADLYLDRGCLISMYQNLIGPNGPDSQICTVVAMICGTNVQADSLFHFQKENLSATISIPQFDTSVAIANSNLGGINVFAHFNSFYFELWLSGYAIQDSARSEATQMLKVLEKKSK